MALHPAVRDGEIELAVVVEIEEPGAETRHRQTRGREARGRRTVFVAELAVVDVERVRLIDDVGHEEIEVTVGVDIAGRDPHSRFGLPRGVERDTEKERLVEEAAPALVQPQLIRFAVIRDIEVEPSVIVEIRAEHAETRGTHAAYPRRAGDVREPPAALVAIELVGRSRKDLGRAVVCVLPARMRDLAASSM